MDESELDYGRDVCARVIQKFFRNATGKMRVLKSLRFQVDYVLSRSQEVTGVEIFLCGRKLLFVHNFKVDYERFNCFCEVLLASMKRSAAKAWYVSVALKPKYAVEWIKQMKQILFMCLDRLKYQQPGLPRDDKLLTLYMNVIVLFTDYTLWKLHDKAGDSMKKTLHLLCTKLIDHLVANELFLVLHGLLTSALAFPRPKLAGHAIAAATGIRQLALCQFSPNMMTLFTRHILSVPACIFHLQQCAPESILQLVKVSFISRVVDSFDLSDEGLVAVDPNTAVCTLGNVVQLCCLDSKAIAEQKQTLKLLEILLRLIVCCDHKDVSSKSAVSSWHPFFGWTNAAIDRKTLTSLGNVRLQLQCLWNSQFVSLLFSPILALTPASSSERQNKSKHRFSLFKKSAVAVTVDERTLKEASNVCQMFDGCVRCFNQVATDILIGLGSTKDLVSKMWHFVWLAIGLDDSKMLQIVSSSKSVHPVYYIVKLCCETSQYLLATLDDEELYVHEQHFTMVELQEITRFLNKLVFRMIFESKADSSMIYRPCHSLLMLLYSRNSRRSFCNPDTWCIKNFKVSSFMSELTAGKPRAHMLLHNLPHVIPHRQRVELFHQQVSKEKDRLGLSDRHSQRRPATYITVQRGRVLDDGFAQLSTVSATSFKGTIRVKFVNEQGLDEAGIDEMGVFKEFLEEVINKAFDPALSLFEINSEGHHYPSPTSHVHENHLSMFEFVGKMLGKAVYEGVVVDVPFALFFLSQMLEHNFSAFYSHLDELPSLDPELYKNLCYVKHYSGDVSDLCLMFSWDENFLGKIITHELIPGGTGIPVTNENKINYVHRMAHFRMNTQLRKQSVAFIKGFHSIINASWIACFSPQELQALISGENVEIDLDDLRKHCQYYGGYHDKHKIIVWLWDILRTEFTTEEKSKFLKFVTSCSRPPLLGFTHLEPPFSIRCVQVSEEEDQGDSLGSVLKGLFSVRHRGARDRLPTASTCFNLLKLPSYSSKSVLRSKLKYAITSNAGFELS